MYLHPVKIRVEFSQLNHRINDVKLLISIMEDDEKSDVKTLDLLYNQVGLMEQYRDSLNQLAQHLDIKV